jgi:hypothetical protein
MPPKNPAPERLTAQCTLRSGAQFSSGTATLTPERLAFQGYFRFELALGEIRSVEVIRDVLKLETAAGYVTLKLGKPARAWAEFIQSHRGQPER